MMRTSVMAGIKVLALPSPFSCSFPRSVLRMEGREVVKIKRGDDPSYMEGSGQG
jgi:hypothetical protein